MQRGIEEGKQPQQATELDEPAQPRRKPPQWRDGQRNDQQQQSGVARGSAILEDGRAEVLVTAS